MKRSIAVLLAVLLLLAAVPPGVYADGGTAELIRTEIKKGLISAHGFIRRELAASLNLRVTPELTFIADTSAEYGSHVDEVLKQIKAEDEKRPKPQTEPEEDGERD